MLDTWSDRIGHGQTSFGLRSRRRGRGGGPAPVVPAIITIVSIAAPDEDGEADVAYSINKNDAGVQAVLYLSAEAPPGAADFGGGGDPAYIDLGTVALDTSGTPIDLAIPDELNGSYRLALLPSGGGDADVVASDAVNIDTRAPAADPMGDDAGKIYAYDAADATRSGTNVTSVPSKYSAGPALTSIGAFGAPQQADADSPLAFLGATPTVIQTATADEAHTLLTDHMRAGGGSMRLFMVVDADSLGTSGTALFAESQGDGANDSWYFGVYVDGSGFIKTYMRARRFDDAFNGIVTSSTLAAGFGLFIIELNVTQTTWEVFLNGSSIGGGATDATKFPNPSSAWVSMGARASGTAASVAGTGDLSFLYVTGTQDGTALAAIRNQIASEKDITL